MFSVMIHLDTVDHQLTWLRDSQKIRSFESMNAAKRAATIERIKNPERIHALYIINADDEVVSTWHKQFKKWLNKR